MREFHAIAASALLLGACGQSAEPPAPPADASAAEPPAPAPGGETRETADGWTMEATEGGALLTLRQGSAAPALRLFCPAARSELLVNVPAFRPVGSEERLSFGSGGQAIALVADTRGDADRGGVSATGAVPRNLAAVIAGELSASYGSQISGPHPAPPPLLAQRFAAACYKRLSVTPTTPPGELPSPTVPVGPCMMQGSERLAVAALRVVGTEPFWAARIEGRCVTYSHPDDQLGTRVWTRYTPSPGGGTWTGALGGQRFELRTRAAPGCSDGMSDTSYPIAVELLVRGERRQGCAAPL